MVDLYFPLANSDTEDAVLSVSNMNTYEYNPFEGFDYNSEDFNQPSMSVFQPSISLVDTSYFH